MRIHMAVTVLALLLLTGASSPRATADKAAKAWVCIGAMSGGFAPNRDTHRWELRAFPPGRYVVTKGTNATAQKFPWEVRLFGAPDDAVLAFCERDFDAKIHDLACTTGLGSNFFFNRQTLRFTLISASAGYINSGAADLGELPPPTIEIGECSAV